MERGEADGTDVGHPVLGRLDPAAPTPLGSGSFLRRVAAEPVTALLVQRALVMEVAHPKVAAGVADHSSFRRRPLSRVWVTMDAALRLVFGDSATARGAAAQIYRTHDRIAGTVEPGVSYTAHDAELLRWVWATLVDTADTAFGRWIGPLGPSAADALYGDLVAMARFLGIPAGLLPGDRGAFADYLEEVLSGPMLGSTPATRAMAREVLWFHHPLVPSPAVRLQRVLAVATLDHRVLARLALTPDPVDVALGRRLDDLLQRHYRRLPALRRIPAPLYALLRRPSLEVEAQLRRVRLRPPEPGAA